MEQVLQILNNYLAPILIAFVSVVDLPCVVAIINIVSNTKKLKEEKTEAKQTSEIVIGLAQSIISGLIVDLEAELKEVEAEMAIEYNHKFKKLYEQKAERIKARIEEYRAFDFKKMTAEKLKELKEQAKKTIKIKISKKEIK